MSALDNNVHYGFGYQMAILSNSALFKGLVHPKMKILSPLCCSNPIRLSFIFRTQIKIFLMKSESLILHWLLGNCMPSPEKLVKTLLKKYKWLQWLNL